ncbi:hypothetical protein GcM1_250165 [Golovinomyces cichoracearum]|uniref:Uncharacterized protein n=1 Tax=Golovinomyces cichoracearum TaxID=62708 RepID=A0A420IB53_9PEZI|nr:hypothetical protein GcM1_250165 [Golovinomyces cichoracearum]
MWDDVVIRLKVRALLVECGYPGPGRILLHLRGREVWANTHTELMALNDRDILERSKILYTLPWTTKRTKVFRSLREDLQVITEISFDFVDS